MSKEREILKEFIDFVDSYEFYPTERSVIWEIVNRANAILAQPESTAEAIMPNGVCVSNVYDAYEEGRKSVMSEQEPVAWYWEENTSDGWVESADTDKPPENEYRRNIQPLYLAPPKREPLTDEEIYSIGNKYAFHAAVREIERIHGIGGGE